MYVDRQVLIDVYDQAIEGTTKATEYLNSRGLENTFGARYISHCDVEINDTTFLKSAIIIPVYNVLGELIGLETRNTVNKQYFKLFADTSDIPLFGVERYYKEEAIIVTESAICAESINQANLPIKAVSTMTSDVRALVMLYLAAIYKKIYWAFDNDDSGKRATEEVTNFFQLFFPNVEQDTLMFPYKDPNEFLDKEGRSTFHKHLLKQL